MPAAAPAVRTRGGHLGGLGLLEQISGGAVLIDSRVPDSRAGVTIPGAVNIPHDRIIGFRDQLEVWRLSIFFLNGPQCPQSPTAIRALLEAGCPASGLAYYRGGLHDWATSMTPW
ncbi:rhodanese-like domain-containing protein [Paenarthrobacter sp. DKR-5]|uniref:rhodanese-like domain-containing protein n=1 Tax=Paenarthrobacter sp. DKR-5 TaxID=2835535 RepID=UPI001BDBF1A7|nr:rhodanese-like domain-containing protein [Paenarthrobacter sp. DKR-5]MBT1003905.1 rhodanese-like domain-containing protein [Paenarthrobacter sp. DKR-5]